jgi:hypothetical protein
LESRFFNRSTDCLLRTQVGREQFLSLVLGRRETDAGSPEETCLDAERCFLGKERRTSLLERKGAFEGKSYYWAKITSQSTRRDQGCVLVRENPGSVKREEFVVLVV